MDWSKGFSAKYYASIIDPKLWLEKGQRIEILGGSIKRSDSSVRQTADLECTGFDEEHEMWVRVWLDVSQEYDGMIDYDHVALFTGLVGSPNKDIEGMYISTPLTCYSVLQPLEDIKLPRGWYVAAGTNSGEAIRSLMAPTPAPVEIDDSSPSIQTTIIAEDGETNLTMIDRIVSAVKWRIVIDGDGTIHFTDRANTISSKIDSVKNDLLETSLNIEYDWYSCPNVFRAIMGEDVEVVRDDDEDSIFSTVARGREVWFEEIDCTLKDGESLLEYARRRLKEEQSLYHTINYTRRFDPNINVSDYVSIKYPDQGISGNFYVTSQSIDLGYGARVSEVVEGRNG